MCRSELLSSISRSSTTHVLMELTRSLCLEVRSVVPRSFSFLSIISNTATTTDLLDGVSRQMAVVATLLNVPLISPGARAPVFSVDHDSFQYFSRTISNLLQEAEVILSLCKRQKWDSMVLWHSDSELGDGLSAILASADGMEVVNVPVPRFDIGIEAVRSLSRILTLRFRLIVVHAEPDLARLMMSSAKNAGILNGDVRITTHTTRAHTSCVDLSD